MYVNVTTTQDRGSVRVRLTPPGDPDPRPVCVFFGQTAYVALSLAEARELRNGLDRVLDEGRHRD